MYQRWPRDLASDVHEKIVASGAKNVCFTGGEPFLQNHEQLLRLMKETHCEEIVHWEAFTNGTFEIPRDFFERGLAPVMDWKLPGSGEKTWINSRSRNLKLMREYDQGAVKFTVANAADFAVAFQIWESLVMDSEVPVFVGPVWDGEAWGGSDIANLIVEFKVPWRLNIQVHNFVYGAHTRGT